MSEIYNVKDISDVFSKTLTFSDKIVVNKDIPELAIVIDKIGDVFYHISSTTIYSDKQDKSKFRQAKYPYIKFPNGDILHLKTDCDHYEQLNNYKINTGWFHERNDPVLGMVHKCVQQYDKNSSDGKEGDIIHLANGRMKYIVIEYNKNMLMILGIEQQTGRDNNVWHLYKAVYIINVEDNDKVVVVKFDTEADRIFDHVMNSNMVSDYVKQYVQFLLSTHREMTHQPYKVRNTDYKKVFDKLQMDTEEFEHFFHPSHTVKNLECFITDLGQRQPNVMFLLDGKEILVGAQPTSTDGWKNSYEFIMSGGKDGLSPFDGIVYEDYKVVEDPKDYHKTYLGIIHGHAVFVEQYGIYVPAMDKVERYRLRSKIEAQIALAAHLQEIEKEEQPT